MNKFFKSATDRYSKIKEKDYLIAPISEVDAEIIVELSQILKKAGLTEVCEILKNYKELKDEEIRDNLLQWNIDNPSMGVAKLANTLADKLTDDLEGNGEPPRPPYVTIKELTFRVFELRGYVIRDRYDEVLEDLIYELILNPTPENTKQVPLYANYVIEFEDEENRNRVLEELKSVLSDSGIDLIDLNGTYEQ
jgi:hypothetical protein